MIKILNQNREPVAILENAYGIGYEKEFNAIWSAQFSLPLDDEKNEHCKPLYYVEVYDNSTLAEDGNIDGDYVGLFRIIPKETVIDEGGNKVTYQCEHVLATLLDSSIFKYRQIDGLPTKESIEYVLGFQHTKHWKMGTCEITRYFSYKFENDNVLSALFSIPKPFDQQYIWTWNTQVYPWVLSLEIPDSEPTCEIREGKNLRGLTLTEDPMGIYNRIYPLGYGEGDNQLTIESVNGGVPYIEDAASVAEYGVRMYIWPDKRFEDAAVLKASAESLLKKWREVIASWKISAADLSSITGEPIDKLTMGKVVRLAVPTLKQTVDLRIVKEKKSDVTGNPGAIDLEIGNKTEDLGTTQTDLERRQQVNELYSQGATNLGTYNFNDNADQNNPAEIMFYLPDEMVRINKLLLTYKTDNFRAYEQATEGGGSTSVTSSSGGGSTATSSSGGGTSTTTESGGGTTATTQSAGAHRHQMFGFQTDMGSTSPPTNFKNYVATANSGGSAAAGVFFCGVSSDLYTNEAAGAHSHNVTFLAHVHSITIPNHTHTVVIPNHTHVTTLPNHVHAIKFGIYKHPDLPTKLTIKVDGNVVGEDALEYENLDIIDFLDKDSDGKVTRGWHVISITPNDLGRINANVISQFFIQSRGGGSF